MQRIEIRPFQEADHDDVVSLWTTVFGYAAAHNDPAAIIRHKLALQRELFFVGLLANRIIGMVMGGYDGHRGWIYSLAVSPEVRRQGIGRALMNHAGQALKDLGCPTKINLQVVATNAAVLAFYTELGYAVEERVSLGKLV